MTETASLNITWTPGRGESGTITAELGGNTLLVDQGNLKKQKFREDFIRNLASKYPEIHRPTVRDELIQLSLGTMPKKNAPETEITGDVKMARPERFILPEVNGILCPVTILKDGTPAGKWKQYIHWPDGRREERDFESMLKIGESNQVYFTPTPSTPVAGEPGGWSMDSRQLWLSGEFSPNPSELFISLCEKLTEFLDFDNEIVPAVLASWIFMTYNYPVWTNVPYINVTGPLGSGKSQLLDCLGRLSYRSIVSSSMTGPALFRSLHDKGGTLILDEAERLKQDDQQELLTMLLAGYKRGGKAIRLEKSELGDFTMKQMDVYGPKALGGIASLPATLASRCIQIPMFRSGPDSDKPRRRLDADPSGWQRLRDDLHMVSLEYGATFIDLANDSSACPADFGGRNYQLWQPILSIGKWIESLGVKNLTTNLTDYARRSMESAKESQVPELDEIVLTVFSEKIRSGNIPTSSDILVECQEREMSGFRKWTARTISNLLARYGFKTNSSNGRRSYRDITLDDLHRVETCYGVNLNL